ncbi:hypothetical protein [Flavobacterium sp.]|uniref:hypothetical protein n=1 Tax=Flavobacterium sp. TaxID=239 RepID=UPI003D290274
MKQLFIIVISLSLFNCQKTEQIILPEYNSVANELIQQVLKDNSFSDCCLLEIPEKTFLEIREEEMPLIAISTKKIIMEKLQIKSDKSLDSLENQTRNFKINSDIINKYKLNLVNNDVLRFTDENLIVCPKGILIISKPIFDKNYKTAVVSIGFGYTCSLGHIEKYRWKNGKWKQE